MSQKVTPELAAKVIRADLKNIIDKVGAGKPLSGVERSLFDALRLDSEDLVKRRQLALLAKWTGGKRLNSSELAEISELLPVEAIPEEPPAVPKKARNGYLHPYKYYEALYGKNVRTIKRWVALGKEPDEKGKTDPTPLDDPLDLRSWWGRNMSQQCPPGILAAAVAHTKTQRAAEPKSDETPEIAPAVEPEEKPTFVPRELAAVGEDEVGLEATLTRLRDAEVQAHRIMIEALQKGDDGKAQLAQKMWTGLTAQVRQVEKDARVDAEARGHLIPRGYAETKLTEFFVPIERGTRGMYRKMCEVMGIAIDADSEEQWNRECDRLFAKFNSEVFS